MQVRKCEDEVVVSQRINRLKRAYGYVEILSVVTIHFVQSFCQRRVNNQLATSPVLRRRLSLNSLFVAFHHICQNLEIEQMLFCHLRRSKYLLASITPPRKVNTPQQVMESITCNVVNLFGKKHSKRSEKSFTRSENNV